MSYVEGVNLHYCLISGHLNFFRCGKEEMLKNHLFIKRSFLKICSKKQICRLGPCVFRPFFWRKSLFRPISTQGPSPHDIHCWKSMDLMYLNVQPPPNKFEPVGRQIFVTLLERFHHKTSHSVVICLCYRCQSVIFVINNYICN